MMLNGLIFLVLIGICHSQVDRDWSLEKMCEHHQGEYTKRPGPRHPNPVGDRCKFKFQYATGDPELAMKFCTEMVPYHINKATADGDYTLCEAEAGLICRKNWIQLYGRCYMMEKKLMKFTDATAHCRSLGATIGFIHRDILPVHWKDYYTGVSKMWVEASAVIRDDLVYNTGDHMMLVLNGWHYGVKSFSLIRVDGNVDKAMVLCEYTPKMTSAETSYLVRRYSEIYFPGFSTARGMFIRTVNQRHADNANRKNAETAYCKQVMKPFLNGVKAESLEASADEKEFLEKLKTDSKQKITVYRSTDFYRKTDSAVSLPRSERDMRSCGKFEPYVPDHRKFRLVDKKDTCDAGSWSHCVNILSKGPLVLELCSDALRAPLYCQAVIGVQEYGPCPAGYTEFIRPTGVKWCHKYFAVEKNVADAEQECFTQGAHLTGFENRAELDLLIGLMRNSPNYKQNSRNDVWLGGKRRDVCRWGANGGSKGWRDGENDCSRKLVFYWDHYVAGSPPKFEDSMWYSSNEPNYEGQNENCLSILEWAGKTGLNDLPCEKQKPFICGKEATSSG